MHGFLSAMWAPNYDLAYGAAFVSLAQRLCDMSVIVQSSPLAVSFPGQGADVKEAGDLFLMIETVHQMHFLQPYPGKAVVK